MTAPLTDNQLRHLRSLSERERTHAGILLAATLAAGILLAATVARLQHCERRLAHAEDLSQCLIGCRRCGCQHPACSWCRDYADIHAALAAWAATEGQEP